MNGKAKGIQKQNAQLRKEEEWVGKPNSKSAGLLKLREKQPQAEKKWSTVLNVQRQGRRIDNEGKNIRTSIKKTVDNLPETKHRNRQAFQKSPKATWPVFSYFPLVLLLGFSLLTLTEPELEHIPKGRCITVQDQWKMTWKLPLCNAVEEPLGWAALREPTPDTSGTASPIGQTREAFLFVRGKEKRSSSFDPDRLQRPLGKQQMGDPPAHVASSSTCRPEEGASRGSRASIELEWRQGRPPGQLSLFGESAGK